MDIYSLHGVSVDGLSLLPFTYKTKHHAVEMVFSQ